MKRRHAVRRLCTMISIVVLAVFASPGLAFSQVTAVQESITVSTASPLTEAILDGSGADAFADFLEFVEALGTSG